MDSSSVLSLAYTDLLGTYLVNLEAILKQYLMKHNIIQQTYRATKTTHIEESDQDMYDCQATQKTADILYVL